ncbi:hypothetical protein CEQ90_00390 [Lewinellaceae bacterium SD302]|nr:hypothetical protein CEQ90_00390 [Lewinellaceae bacterium SD302]
MTNRSLCTILLFCLSISLLAQDAPKEQPYRMGHTHGYFPYDETDCKGSKHDCSQKALAAFLDSVWQQPLGADGNPVHGKVAVSFIVEKSGKLTSIKVFDDPQNGLKEAGIASLERMNELDIRWVPGEYKENVIRSQQSLKFPFRKSEHPVLEPTKSTLSEKPERDIFKVVEKMPMFPGCEEIQGIMEQAQCAQKRLLEFIYGNVRYTPEAEANGTEGMAVVSFVIEPDGRVTDPKIVRDPGDGLGAMALDVIKLMQTEDVRWMPGTQGGIARAVLFNLPVKFKLPN